MFLCGKKPKKVKADGKEKEKEIKDYMDVDWNKENEEI